MAFKQIFVISFGDTLLPEIKTSLIPHCGIFSIINYTFLSMILIVTSKKASHVLNDSFTTFYFDIVKASHQGPTIII